MSNILKNYIKQIILLEQKSNKYNIFIQALENSNKSDLLDNINEDEISNKLSNLKKYQFEWLLNYINSDILEAEGLSEIIQIVIDFDKHKNALENKELLSYKTVNEIRKELEKPSKRQIKKNKRLDLKGEYEIVYEDEKIIIYFPHSEKASCEIANRMGFGGVTWCTAAEKTDNYFASYSLDDEIYLYYILSKIDNNSNMDKISIGIFNNQIIYENNATVNSSNIELNKNDLENYFGREYWDKISNILLNFNKKYEDHPAINHLTKKEDIANYSKNKNIQLTLSKDEDVEIRRSLAFNLNLDRDVQSFLARDKDIYVRKYLSSNLNLDRDVQLFLARDKEINVRRSLSSNLNLDRDVQFILARDKEINVRRSLAFNKNLDKDVQFILARDEHIYVREYLSYNLNLDKQVQFILARDKSVNISLASNETLSKEIQFFLVKDENPDVRKNLANNPNIDRDIQYILAKDEKAYVRKNLAFNSNIDRDIQYILAKDEDADVRRHLLSNSSIDNKVRKMLKNE